MLKAVFLFWKDGPWIFGCPERPTGVLKAVFIIWEMIPGFSKASNVYRACSRLLFFPAKMAPVFLKALDDQTAQVLRRVDTKANEKVEKLGVVKVGHRDRKRNFNGI